MPKQKKLVWFYEAVSTYESSSRLPAIIKFIEYVFMELSIKRMAKNSITFAWHAYR